MLIKQRVKIIKIVKVQIESTIQIQLEMGKSLYFHKSLLK
ncbi:unnamed protein product [Paramecium sonneborni]|uniref:Uncharacterized protein n=1 Tax=Paramecium sonneborni TaxID=65129 RepID=A0A8S1Q4Y6_9CILI|nr:unnamed protein product [Paramecium sonneborni]